MLKINKSIKIQLLTSMSLMDTSLGLLGPCDSLEGTNTDHGLIDQAILIYRFTFSAKALKLLTLVQCFKVTLYNDFHNSETELSPLFGHNSDGKQSVCAICGALVFIAFLP